MSQPRTPLKQLALSRLKPWHLDLLLLFGLFCMNPLMWGWRLPPNLTPDAIAYLIFAEDGISAGKLFLPSWGHVDLGLILPPLYPALISLATRLGADPIASAVNISAATMMLTSVPLFLMTRRLAGPWIAAVTVLLIQLNYYYLFFGSAIGTEALFLLLLASSLHLALLRVSTPDRKPALAFVLGIVIGITYLARQLGLLLLPFLAAWIVFDLIRHKKKNPVTYVRELALLVCGWAIIVATYAITLDAQTDASPFRQTFRMHSYVVHSVDPAVFETIASFDPKQATNYVELYARRRMLRTLLPDSSEMLAFVKYDGVNEESDDDDDDSVWLTPADPATFTHNVLKNVDHLGDLIGFSTLILFAVALATAVAIPYADMRHAARLTLPTFLVFYLIAISALTGVIARYVIVLFPLILAFIGAELGAGLHKWRRRHSPKLLVTTLAVVAVAAILLVSPRTLVSASPWDNRSATLKIPKRTTISSGEPAFALLPINSYLVGADYRILPNDSLKKVVRYAQLTGVHWLIVPTRPETIVDTHFYANAPWLLHPSELAKQTALLRYCCTVAVPTEHMIFQILPATATR